MTGLRLRSMRRYIFQNLGTYKPTKPCVAFMEVRAQACLQASALHEGYIGRVAPSEIFSCEAAGKDAKRP